MRGRFHTLVERLRGAEGAQAVEFALVLPILLLLVLGIINFGYVFGQKLSLNQAVREGARMAVVDKAATNNTVRDNVRAATGGLISPTTAVSVASLIQDPNLADEIFDTSGTCDGYNKLGGQLQVTATYPSSWRCPIAAEHRGPDADFPGCLSL